MSDNFLQSLLGGNNQDESTDGDTDAEAPLSDEHKDAIGNALSQAAEARGIDISTLAPMIGLSTDDVNSFTQGDYLKVVEHLAAEHPELVQSLAGRIPFVGNLIGGFLGGNR